MRVILCGFGHAVHALVPLMATAGFDVHIFNHLEREEGEVEITEINSGLRGRATISSDPACILGAGYIVMPLPSDAYACYLGLLAPHIKENHTLVVTPGQGQFSAALSAATDCDPDVCYVLPMPVNSRCVEERKLVDVKAYKKNFIFLGAEKHQAALSDLFQADQMEFREGGGTLADLMPINPVIHPARLFRLFRFTDYVPENPLFYEDMEAEDILWMDQIQCELQVIGKEHGLEVPGLFEFLSKFTYQTEHTCALDFFTKYPAYKGFRSPLIETENGWAIDPKSRYLTEDIECGLRVYQKYAREKGVQTPVMDMIERRLREHCERVRTDIAVLPATSNIAA